MTTRILYPKSLPGPASAPFQSAERRLTSDDPFATRAVQRDRLGIQRVTFPPLTAAQAQTFEAWWRDDLTFGGSWFGAQWPLPQGSVMWARRFMGAPKWQFLAGGYWRVSADFEVRGDGLIPVYKTDLWLSLQGETMPFRCRQVANDLTTPLGPWVGVETVNYAEMCPAVGLTYSGFGASCTSGFVAHEAMPLQDSSTHARTVTTVPAYAGSTTLDYAYAGDRSITSFADPDHHFELAPLPIRRGIWSIEVAVRLASFAGPMPLVFQAATLSDSDSTVRNVLDFYAVVNTIGGDVGTGIDFVATGWANTTTQWSLTKHLSNAPDWLLVRLERDDVEGTEEGIARLYFDDVLVASTPCPKGTGGLPYPVLSDALWIGKRTRPPLLPMLFAGYFDAMTIRTAG